MKQLTVLIVEDDSCWMFFITYLLEKAGLNVIKACSLEEGWTLFCKHKEEIEFIIMDACVNSVPSWSPNSSWLVRLIREAGFKGVIIPATDSEDGRQQLLMAGADYIPEADINPKKAAAELCIKLAGELNLAKAS